MRPPGRVRDERARPDRAGGPSVGQPGDDGDEMIEAVAFCISRAH